MTQQGIQERDTDSLSDAIDALQEAGFAVESVGKMHREDNGVYISLGVTTPNRIKPPEGSDG